MKELKFICAQPDDTYYTWQVHAWLESLRNLGHSDKAIVLVFTPNFRQSNQKWKQVEELYPEAEFAYFRDEHNISKHLGLYVSILRPYTLARYWELHPELKENAIFYCDCDVLFTDNFNIDAYIDDDINYLSDTNSYINASYFDGKIHQVLPDKLEDFKQIDVLDDLGQKVGISREIAEKYNMHSGGAQYLLKNIEVSFWQKMVGDTLTIRTYLLDINRKYFENENAGYQSWCADMWGLLWGLWAKGAETKVIPEMEFSWATDPIDKVHRLGIYHNAGVTSETLNGFHAFYKGKYHEGADPFKDATIYEIANNEVSVTKGTYYYLTELLKIKNKYKLNY
jgi:hypothetical protein